MDKVTARPYFGKNDRFIAEAIASGDVTADDSGGIYLGGEPMRQGSAGNGYLRVRYEGRQLLAHRVVYWCQRGPIPAGYVVNHMNLARYDNRIVNLEAITQQQNLAHAAGTASYCRVRPTDIDVVDSDWLVRVLDLARSGNVSADDVNALRSRPVDRDSAPFDPFASGRDNQHTYSINDFV